MRRQVFVIAIAVATAIGPQAATAHNQAAVQLGPDLSGRWTRESGGRAQSAGDNAGWGPSIEIEQTSNELTIRAPHRAPTRYRADGREVTETLSKAPCFEQSRVTKTVAASNSFTITIWLVTRTSCFHGEQRIFAGDPESPYNPQGRPVGVTRILESITTVARVGDRLTVDTTTGSPAGSTSVSSSAYRK